MERITEGMMRKRFELFCKAMGKRVATSYNDVGAYRLDKLYGRYAIEEISNDKGGVRNPISHARYTKRELCDVLYFATNAIYEKESVTV